LFPLHRRVALEHGASSARAHCGTRRKAHASADGSASAEVNASAEVSASAKINAERRAVETETFYGA